jgi:hypothetical protein
MNRVLEGSDRKHGGNAQCASDVLTRAFSERVRANQERLTLDLKEFGKSKSPAAKLERFSRNPMARLSRTRSVAAWICSWKESVCY